MAFTDEINIEINSIFDSEGFKQAQSRLKNFRKSLANARSNIAGFNKQFRFREPGGSRFVSRDALSRVERMRQRMSALGNQVRDVAGRGFNRLRNSMGGLRSSMSSTGSKIGSVARDKIGGFRQNMGRAKRVTGRMAKVSGGLARTIGGMGRNFLTGSRRSSEFRFELLGLMFAGMALQKAMTGLLRPALKAVGVFDIFSTTMKLLFLPVALDILDVVLDLQEFIVGLDDETKSLIGRLTVVAAALGTVLFVGGQLGLAFNSLIIFIKSLASVMNILSLGAFVALLGAAAAAVGVLTAEGETLTQKWENFTGTLNELLPEVFEFTETAAKQLASFLGTAFNKIKTWFTSQDWSQVWANVFEWQNKSRDDVFEFFDKAIAAADGEIGDSEATRVWEDVFEFTDGMLSNLGQFVTDATNEMAVRMADNRNDIWGKVFKFKSDVKAGVARFTGQLLGQIIRSILDVKWGEVFKAALKGEQVNQETFLPRNEKIGDSFAKGFEEGFEKPTRRSGFVPDSGAEVRQTMGFEVNVDMDQNGNVTNQDVKRNDNVFLSGTRGTTGQTQGGT